MIQVYRRTSYFPNAFSRNWVKSVVDSRHRQNTSADTNSFWALFQFQFQCLSPTPSPFVIHLYPINVNHIYRPDLWFGCFKHQLHCQSDQFFHSLKSINKQFWQNSNKSTKLGYMEQCHNQMQLFFLYFCLPQFCQISSSWVALKCNQSQCGGGVGMFLMTIIPLN